uniref:SET domain-containing protein n=1 Tax=Aureoumbra lagunensis TaxID=44058 RepID=A0A7S3K3T8_9STRA|mmetsp:Transcript_10268/g.15545  ORF Transcript_10268/g.15545 Transcript_10268/m.15545 type:complete len:575 (-) Transcript_10268:277-2001(-)
MPRSRLHRRRRLQRLRQARDGFASVGEMFQLAEMAVLSNEHPVVKLPLPLSLIPDRDMMELVEIPNKGRGWIAVRDILPGTTLCTERCLAMVYDHDCEEDEEEFAEESSHHRGDNSDTARLVLRILNKAKNEENYWEESGLCHLFPRTYVQAQRLEPWQCCDTFLDAAVAHAIQSALKKMPQGNWDLLPLIVRHNALGVATSPEMLSHPTSNWPKLSGLALYGYRPSSFNHSSKPNVMRWHCGDIGIWLVIRPVGQGEELTISYFESELLNDKKSKPLQRLALSHLEFGQDHPGEEEKIIQRILDVDEQNRLVSEYGPKARLTVLKKLKPKLKCDKLQKYILQALSWAEANNPSNARRSFIDALHFARSFLPPLDEQIICLGFHAARAALASDQFDQAASLLEDAADAHNLVFGGGRRLFLQRFYDDLQLDLGYRPKTNSEDLFNLLLDKGFNAQYLHHSPDSKDVLTPFSRKSFTDNNASDSDEEYESGYPVFLYMYDENDDDDTQFDYDIQQEVHQQVIYPTLQMFMPTNNEDSDEDSDDNFEIADDEYPNDAIIYMDIDDEEDDIQYDIVD